MAADGQKDWVELYRSALMELDRANLPSKINAATSAIQLRINELLMQKNTSQEHLQLEDALRNLRTLDARPSNPQYKRNGTSVVCPPVSESVPPHQ